MTDPTARPAAAVSSPPPDQTAVERVAEVLRPHASLGGTPPRYELPFFDGATPSLPRISGWKPLDDVAAALAAVLPPTVDRAAEFELRGTAEIRAAALLEAADFVRGLLLTRTLVTTTSLEAELRRLAAEAQPEPGVDLIEDYLKFLRGQGPEPDLSGLTEEQRAAITGHFEIVKALADRDPELPPLDRDSVARRLGLHEDPAAEAQQSVPLRAELKPWQLLGAEPDGPVPQTERFIGGRRIRAETPQQPEAPALDLHGLTRQATAIWGETPTPLPHAVTILTVVAGDIARQARNEAEGRPVDRAKLAKELGNWILTTIRVIRDAGLDPDDCVGAALQAQQRYAAKLGGHEAVQQQPDIGDGGEQADGPTWSDTCPHCERWYTTSEPGAHEAACPMRPGAGAQQQADTETPTESVIYEVVGDWGVDSADSEAGARAAVAKWLRAYPKCGAYAQQRIVREWPDGSEFYGPWTDLPPAVPVQPAAADTREEGGA